MCFPQAPPARPAGEMGFDASLLKSVLEQFVDEISEESADLIVERPRFAHAVVVVADASEGEICQASCIRQLDQFTVVEQDNTTTVVVDEDDAIQRALAQLMESREMLSVPQEAESSDYDEPFSGDSSPSKTETPLHSNQTTGELIREINRSASTMNKSGIQFPSMSRARTNV